MMLEYETSIGWEETGSTIFIAHKQDIRFAITTPAETFHRWYEGTESCHIPIPKHRKGTGVTTWLESAGYYYQWTPKNLPEEFQFMLKAFPRLRPAWLDTDFISVKPLYLGNTIHVRHEDISIACAKTTCTAVFPASLGQGAYKEWDGDTLVGWTATENIRKAVALDQGYVPKRCKIPGCVDFAWAKSGYCDMHDLNVRNHPRKDVAVFIYKPQFQPSELWDTVFTDVPVATVHGSLVPVYAPGLSELMYVRLGDLYPPVTHRQERG
jgi:hypothetical protein